MAVNMSRSMNQSMLEGSTDGKYRKAAPDRTPNPGGGFEQMMADRASLHPWYNYGYITDQAPAPLQHSPGV